MEATIKIRILGPLAVERLIEKDQWEHVPIGGREPPGLLGILSAVEDEVSRADILARLRNASPYHNDQPTYDWTADLRKALDANEQGPSGSVIETNRRGTIRLRRERGVWIDYDAFKAFRDGGQHAEALRLVRGDLVENLSHAKLKDLRDQLLEEINDSRDAITLPAVESARFASRGLPSKTRQPVVANSAQAAVDPDRRLDWESFHEAVTELGRRLFADKAYGGFWPDAIVGVNHGGAMVAGMLYYVYVRTFEIFVVAAREGDFVSSPDHLNGLVELADRHQRPIRVLLVDDSMKTGESLRLARSTVESALAGRNASIRVAVLVYRPDYHEQAGNSTTAPDEHIRTDIDNFPYGPV